MLHAVTRQFFMFALALTFSLSAVDSARMLCCDGTQQNTNAPPFHEASAAHAPTTPDTPEKPCCKNALCLKCFAQPAQLATDSTISTHPTMLRVSPTAQAFEPVMIPQPDRPPKTLA